MYHSCMFQWPVVRMIGSIGDAVQVGEVVQERAGGAACIGEG